MAQEPILPEGKVIRVISGGQDSLKKVLLDLKKYSFSGYVRSVLDVDGKESEGFVILVEGNPEASLHYYDGKEERGKASLKHTWQDSYDTKCKLEIHAKVDAEALIAEYPDASLGVSKRRSAKRQAAAFDGAEAQKKIDRWRADGYDVESLVHAMRQGPQRATQALRTYEENVKKLEILKEILVSMDVSGFEERAEQLRERFRDPNKHLALEAEIQKLREDIELSRAKEKAKREDAKEDRQLEDKAREVFEMVVRHRAARAASEGAERAEALQVFLERPAVHEEDTNLVRQYTFDNFVVGPSNRFAYAACTAVAKAPRNAYNPLFITSGPGLGKTHLLNAIGDYIRERNPDSTILFTTAESFSNEFLQAKAAGNLETFRRKYRSVDVLLLDDAHFLSGKAEIQEELFHTFNHLHNASKQIVLTSDRPPKQIPELEERLVSRFESGLVADIQAPDPEMRVAILRKRSKDVAAQVDDAVLNFVANIIESNVRELVGALNRIIAFSTLMDQPITISLARDVLRNLVAVPEPAPEVTQVDRELKPGRSYLIEEPRPAQVFRLLLHGLRGKDSGLVITRQNPKRLREKYDLADQQLLWLTDRESSTETTISPSLERIIYVIEEFVKGREEGAILIDGVEYLVSNSSFDAVLRFLRRLLDFISETHFVLTISLSPMTLKEQEVKILEKEMEVLTFD